MPFQLMYSSAATAPMGAESLEKILADARVGNRMRDVTGALVYVDGVFFQILEGEEAVVRQLVASIASDSRHHSVTVIHEAHVDARAFESWTMAYLSPTAEEMAAWAGLPATATIGELAAWVNRAPDQVPRVLVSVLEELAR